MVSTKAVLPGYFAFEIGEIHEPRLTRGRFFVACEQFRKDGNVEAQKTQPNYVSVTMH